MNRSARWNQLLELLAERGRLSVRDAADALEVSTATVRRDLAELEGQQMLRRTRGGAVTNGVSYDLPLRYKTARQADEKHRIGAEAASMVAPGMVVGLNGGTTTTEVARALGARADLSDGVSGPALTIVTNALNIGHELTVRPHVKIVIVGGVVRTRSYEVTGPLARATLSDLALDIVFLGVDALDPVAGAMAHNEDEASTNRLMASRAQEVIVVADSSKLGRRAFARICGIDQVKCVITDSGASQDIVGAFAEAGVPVTLT